MKHKDVALVYLARILLWIPSSFAKRWGMAISTRIIAKCVVESVNNYREALDMMNSGELKDNPLWQSACGLSAILALMPVVMIYGYARDTTEKKENIK